MHKRTNVICRQYKHYNMHIQNENLYQTDTDPLD